MVSAIQSWSGTTKSGPVEMQVDDLLDEIRKVTRDGYRTLCTVLTKRMAEDLTEYLHEQGIKVRYMHSDIDTIERIEILRDLRLGAFDVLIGINLLREGLIPLAWPGRLGPKSNCRSSLGLNCKSDRPGGVTVWVSRICSSASSAFSAS